MTVSELNFLTPDAEAVAFVEMEAEVEFPSYPPRKDCNTHKVEDDGEGATRRRLENATSREAVLPMPRNEGGADERLAAARRVEEYSIMVVVAKRIRCCIVSFVFKR